MSRGCRRHKGTSGIEDILTFLKGTMVERSPNKCALGGWRRWEEAGEAFEGPMNGPSFRHGLSSEKINS